MFSPTKLVSATAVAALAGVLLLAGPFTTQESVPPPAASSVESDTSGATLVRGELEMNRDYPGRSESLDWGYSLTDALNTIELTMSDERLSGRGRLRWNAHADDWTWVWTESVYLENEGGSWVGSGFGYMDPPSTGGELGAGNHERLVLEGQDGYAGLTAILDFDEKDSDSPTEVTGAIMAMTLPQTPGDAPTTFE